MRFIKQRLIVCFMIPYLTAGCSDSDVTFLSTHGDEEHWLFEEQTCATLSSLSLYALNGDVALVSGMISTTRMPSYRPMFLRTANGGSSWKEVIQPSYGMQVTDIHFNNESEGWALAMGSIGGPGGLTIFRTGDSGASWKEMSDVPKSYWDGQPNDVYFYDANHGFVEITYSAPPNQEFGYGELLETRDGGATWAVTLRMPLQDFRQEIQDSLANNKVYKNDSVGMDGTRWALEDDIENYIVRIRRFSEVENQLKLVQTIKEPLLVKNGVITSMGLLASIKDERCWAHPPRS